MLGWTPSRNSTVALGITLGASLLLPAQGASADPVAQSADAAVAEERYPVGSRALIDVSVATLWREPRIHRRIDRPSLRNPVAVGRWNRNLRTADQRRWLVGNVQTQALYGMEVLVRERRGRWVKVAVIDEPEPQDPAGYPGWLPARQLRPKSDLPSVTDASDYVVVLAKRSRVRLDEGSVAVGYGTRFALPEAAHGGGGTEDAGVAQAGWVQVITPAGPGLIPGSDVGAPKQLSARSVLADGRRFLGLRYLWGGLSAWGMDCSGLIWNLFRAHGETIPRDADPQFRSGRRVSLERLRRGDLLFWGTREYVHHVALYAGRGRMMEAPDSSGRVRIVPIRWRELIGARRYIPKPSAD